MNVAPSAAPSIGAPAAGVVPGVTAGAAPAAAPSFADLLRTLAGQEAGVPGGEAIGVSATALMGAPARAGKGASAEADPATDGAASGDDVALLTGAFGVPVALPVPVLAQPVATPPEGSSAETTPDGDVAASYQSGGVIAAPVTIPAETAAAAPGAAPEPRQTAAMVTATAVTTTDQITDAPGASVMAPPTTVPGAAAHVGAPAGRGPDSESPDPFVALATDRSVGQARQGRRNEDGAVTAAVTGKVGGEPVGSGIAAPASGLKAGDEAARNPTAIAAAMPAQVMATPAYDTSRGPGLPRALARVLEPGGAGRGREHAAVATTAAATNSSGTPVIDAATLAALANAGAGMADGEQSAADAGDAGDGGSAPGRVTAHPALAAALRAFQQAAAPAAASQATPQGEGETRVPMTAARLAVAFAAVDPASPNVDGDRRPAALTTLLAPLMSAEPKLASEWASAVKAEAAAASVLSSADAEAVHSQVVQSLKLQWAGGAGEATVRLRPEYLGDVTATIKVEQGAVTATLQADRPEVRRWMEANTQTLRDGLVEHGLKLDRLDILAEAAKGGATHDERQGKPRGRQPQPQPQPRPRRERQDDDAPAFSVNP